MGVKELIRRYFVFFLSIFLISLGVSATVCSQLGTSPISSGPYVFSVNTPLSIGTYLFILNIILIVVQMALLGRKEIINNKFTILMQIPISILFGVFTDFAMWLLSDLLPTMYLTKVATLIMGCVILALGIGLEVLAGVAMMSGEYTVQIISKRFKFEFGSVKMAFDTTLVCVAVVSSLLFTATVVGIREGTIITALITGPLVKLCMPRLKFVSRWLDAAHVSKESSSNSVVNSSAVLITISREYGSGGHEIGEMLAKRLGIPFYDKNLVEMVAEEGKFTEKFVQSNEQSLDNSLYSLILHDYEAPLDKSLSAQDLLFVAQSKVINRVAQEGSCVIVGRCASYILDKYPNNISVFLHANLEDKISRVVGKYGIAPDKAAAKIKSIDKARADHYFYYSGKQWGDARSYQLSCNTSYLTQEEICNAIEALYRRA